MAAQRQSSSNAPTGQWFNILARMDEKLDKVLQAVNDNQFQNLQRFGKQDVKIARVEEKVSQRATMITAVGSIITLIAAGLVTFFTKK